MIQYDALNFLLEMDLTQLRAENGHATLNAITVFVQKLNVFFSQFKTISSSGTHSVSDGESKHINSQLQLLLQKLTSVEIEYYRNKYKSSSGIEANTESEGKIDVNDFCVGKLSILKVRMQYWAATDNFGETIRNPLEHRQAIKFLDKWDESYGLNKKCRGSFFKGKKLFDKDPHDPLKTPILDSKALDSNEFKTQEDYWSFPNKLS